MKNEKKMKFVTFKIEIEEWKKLVNLANQEHRSLCSLYRIAARKYLNEKEEKGFDKETAKRFWKV